MNSSNDSHTIPSWQGWAPIVLLPALVLVLSPERWPRWLFMWLLAFAIFAGCKWLTWRRTPAGEAPWRRHAGYLFAWPGLDAEAFLRPEVAPSQGSLPVTRPAAGEWWFATFKLLLGVVIFWGVAPQIPDSRPILQGWSGMVGVILLLHFGLFHLLSCGWRAVGVQARPLMNNPLVSVRLSEFWGKRWNTAFRDLTHRFLFRPLASKLGPRRGMAVGFVFSGLVHDLVISVPARGGYGGPTLFFVLQAVALYVERSPIGRRYGLGRGSRGWLFTGLSLALPAYLLFHPPFVTNVVVPFMRAVGAA